MKISLLLCLVLALLSSIGCKSSGPRSSSSSHFVECSSDRSCLRFDAVLRCDGDYCVDDEGERFAATGTSSDVSSVSGDVSEPACDPTEPLEKPLELGTLLLVAEDAEGIVYAVDEAQSELRLFRSEGQTLVPLEIAGSGQSGDEVTLTVRAPEGVFSLYFAPRDRPTTALLFPGEYDDRMIDPDQIDADEGERLSLLDDAAIDGLRLGGLVSAIEVEYHAATDSGHRIAVVRPERDFDYENFRVFFTADEDEPLVERGVIEVVRAKDGGSTHVRFWADAERADAYFPVTTDGDRFVPGPDASLTLGADEFALSRLDETVDALDVLEFLCFASPPNGWQQTDREPPLDPRDTEPSGPDVSKGPSSDAGPGDGSLSRARRADDDAGTSADAHDAVDAGSPGQVNDGGPTSDDVPEIQCAPGEDWPRNAPDERHRVTGVADSQLDTCTESGDLLEYSCAVEIVAEGQVPGEPVPVANGDLQSEVVDCDGRCEAGRCDAICPGDGDPLDVLSHEGDRVVFRTARDSRLYDCELIFDQSEDAVDCAVDVAAGDRSFISSLGLKNDCTGGNWGNIGVCFDGDCSAEGQNCTYTCQFAYE